MPKNPVRAARQAGRQQVRAAKQTAKVAKIQNRTQTKLGKLQGSTSSASTAASAPKFKTAEELKSTIKMPDFKARAVEMAKDKAKANGTGSTGYKAPATKKSAPVKKSTPKPKATPKATPAPAPAPAKTGPYVVSKAYDEAVIRAKENSVGTYVTKPQDRNKDQQIQLKIDKKKQLRKKLESFMPNSKMGGGVKGKKKC